MIYLKNTKFYNRKSLIKYFIKEKPATYSDTNCTIIQCEEGKYRSVTELLELVQTYFPKTTLNDVLLIIKRLIDEGHYIALVWCTVVNKVVVKYVDVQTFNFVTNFSLNRYLNNKGVDGYSINDYLQIINN